MLFFAALTVVGCHPAAVQAETGRADILPLVLEYCESKFDEAHPGAEHEGTDLVLDRLNRPTVAEGSLEYAAALLMSGAAEGRAAAIIGAVLDAQAGEKPAGAFPWRPDGKPDPEATCYVGVWLAYINGHLLEGLPVDLRSRLAGALAPAQSAVGRLKVGPEETSRFLMKTAALAMLESQTGTPGGAGASFEAWLKYTREKGVAQLLSSSQMVVATAALSWIAQASLTEEMRTGAEQALEYIYRDMALRFHAKAAMLGGAAAHAYPRDYVTALGASRYLLHALFGEPDVGGVPPFGMFLALPGHWPAGEVRDILTSSIPRTVMARTETHEATTHVTPSYSLGTLSGPVVAGTAPLIITYPSDPISLPLAEGEEGPAPEVELPSAYCVLHPGDARATAVQEGPKALVSLDFDNIGAERERLDVFVDIYLGHDETIDSVFVNDAPYDGSVGAAVPLKSAVVTERNGVYTAITVAALGPAVRKARTDPPHLVGTLGWVRGTYGEELVLRLPASMGMDAEPARDNYRVAFAVEMADITDYASATEFARVIYDTRSSVKVTNKEVKVGEKPDNTHKIPGLNRPVERSKWIMETRIAQELQYRSGEDTLNIREDLALNEVVSRSVNGVEVVWDFLYKSASMNHMPGDELGAVMRALPVAEEAGGQE